MEGIKITLETLYDILRNEKKHEDLQKIDSAFFVDVVSYLREKNTLLQSKKQENDLFASGERDKLDYELRSIKRILREIYEKREKKIIDIALNRSKTGSDIIDTSAMLTEEKMFYEELLRTLDTYRQGIIHRIFRAELPDVTMPSLWRPTTFSTHQTPISSYEAEENTDENTEYTPQTPQTPSTTPEIKPTINTSPQPTTITPQPTSTQPPPPPPMTKIKFIHATPRFIWKDLKEYGPFDTGESTEIFPEVADLLVRKGRATKV